MSEKEIIKIKYIASPFENTKKIKEYIAYNITTTK